MADTHHPSHAHAHSPRSSDMGAAFVGLVGGAIVILLILGSIVMLTNRHYAAEKGGAAAEATH